jgi:hypothetical protein
MLVNVTLVRTYFGSNNLFSNEFFSKDPISCLTSLLGFWQELRKSLDLSINLQRKQKDCSSDEYDSIEEDVLPEPEPEDQVSMGHPTDDPLLSSGDSVPEDVPKDLELEGQPPQGPDTLVVLEFNPASKSEHFLIQHFFRSGRRA